MTNFGIDALSFYTTDYYLDLADLAKAQGLAPHKFSVSLGQNKMAMLPPDEDIVTLAANAAEHITTKLSPQEINDIELLLFATESGIDFSKAAGIYVHKLLGLAPRCRVLELKQACFATTGGLQLALSMLRQNPHKKVLLIASDVARYKLNSAAESSQGCSAVAMLLSAEPRLLIIEPESGFYTQDVMDFWRPNYTKEAFVDGKYSCEIYLKMLGKCWHDYCNLSGRSFSDHEYFCYHIPVPKLVETSHKRLAKMCGHKLAADDLAKQVGISLQYSREIGNCYTASLYLGIASLLENNPANLSDKRLGLYSYGSGCTAEYFSAKVVNGYQANLFTKEHQKMLQKRQALSYQAYLDFYNFKLPEDGSSYTTPQYTSGKFRLAGMAEHCRKYSRSS